MKRRSKLASPIERTASQQSVPKEHKQRQPLTFAEAFDWFATEDHKFRTMLSHRDRDEEFGARQRNRAHARRGREYLC
jgi:hypothetical protein